MPITHQPRRSHGSGFSAAARRLHHIFTQSITVRDIAGPLTSFDQDHPAEHTVEFIKGKGFDVGGVRSEGDVKDDLLKKDLTSGTSDEHLRKLNEDAILNENAPMLIWLFSLMPFE